VRAGGKALIALSNRGGIFTHCADERNWCNPIWEQMADSDSQRLRNAEDDKDEENVYEMFLSPSRDRALKFGQSLNLIQGLLIGL
jgi:hypothetical protein